MIFNFILFHLLCSVQVLNANYATRFSVAWRKATIQSLREQAIEDANGVSKFKRYLTRKLIVMPLTEICEPAEYSVMHRKVKYGDKCSFPQSIGQDLYDKPYEVPWLFEISKIKDDVSLPSNTTASNSIFGSESTCLDRVYASPLDFRAPENYILLPPWVMQALGVKHNDIVDVSFVRLKLASVVTLQPLSVEWDTLVSMTENLQALLEHEINKYSSLTSGTNIMINCDGVEYSFYVKDIKADNDVSVNGARIQDSDVKVDIDRSVLDSILKMRAI